MILKCPNERTIDKKTHTGDTRSFDQSGYYHYFYEEKKNLNGGFKKVYKLFIFIFGGPSFFFGWVQKLFFGRFQKLVFLPGLKKIWRGKKKFCVCVFPLIFFWQLKK